MKDNAAIVIVGTFDSKGREPLSLKECIERKGFPNLTVNVGTKGSSPRLERGGLLPKSRLPGS
jgi:uncharacterized protein (UPF0261 family)